MILKRIKNLLNQSYDFLKKGLFLEGLIYIESKKMFFIFLPAKSIYKSEYFFLKGAFLLNSGNTKKSSIYLKRAILNQNLNKSEILLYLIKVNISLNNQQKVKYYFNKIIERSFYPFFILFSFYECLKSGFNPGISRDDLIDFTPDKGDNNSILDELSDVVYLIIIDKYIDAYRKMIKFKKIYNRNYFYNIIFLKVLYNIKKYDELIEYFNDNAAYLTGVECLFIYSAGLYKLNLLDESLKITQELFYADSNIVRNTINFARIYIKKKNYIKAIDLLKRYIFKDNKYKDEILFLLSFSYNKLGLFNDSARCILKISRKSYYFHKGLFNLAIIHYELQNIKKAKELFMEINQVYIDNEKYKKWEIKIYEAEVFVKKNSIRLNLIVIIIFFIPWIILLFSIGVLLFYLLQK